jgi:hypothetical protein
MILVQTVLLKVALDNRPQSGMRNGLEHAPFSAYSREGIIQQILLGKRPYQFWQWPTARPYVPDVPSVLAEFSRLIIQLSVQVLSIPALSLPGPVRRSRLPNANLLLSSVHFLPRLHRSCDRGHPSASTDIQEPSSTLMQGFQVVSHCQLAGR